MVSICLCDDEPVFCRQLHQMLLEYSVTKGVELSIFELYSISDLMASDLNYDVIFLDIRFSGQDMGMQAARILREQKSDVTIIFLTSLPGYSIEGYKVDALRYIVKPVHKAELFEAMDALLEKEQKKALPSARVTVKTVQGIRSLEFKEVLCIKSEPAYRKRRLITHNIDETILTTEALQSLYEKFPQNQFVYTHQRYIINLQHIKRVSGDFVVLSSNISAPIGRKYRAAFFVSFEAYPGEVL